LAIKQVVSNAVRALAGLVHVLSSIGHPDVSREQVACTVLGVSDLRLAAVRAGGLGSGTSNQDWSSQGILGARARVIWMAKGPHGGKLLPRTDPLERLPRAGRVSCCARFHCGGAAGPADNGLHGSGACACDQQQLQSRNTGSGGASVLGWPLPKCGSVCRCASQRAPRFRRHRSLRWFPAW
jgi:hypothetical protein